MTERIFELAKQADLIQWDSLPWNSGARTPDYESVVRARKFAELIVAECLKQADIVRDGFLADDEDHQSLGAEWVGIAIAQHFGVEK